ncbi:bactofilin family protein [Biformimicrobium ophioploci]|uniref:Polymer-forming cytoskeletal protein n=1 Tax=Biformimicrobium ophioploci TaxID=3036711 RepID=A0ABQ6LUC1_9GAMM|nr:polymer-forming cytoskeletal protein [Microbulbifer sp. NKW57]GMG85684.1 hypothetical protein MNKW57_00050 [Microbulbifer sp. NKW57]
MLGRKDKDMPVNSGNSTTLIARHTEVKGNMHFRGNLVIEGRVHGNITAESDSDARVQVIDGGTVEGEIRVPHVVINGSVKGDVHAARHLELAGKAAVEGNVHYKLIEMVKGAQVNGALVSNVESGEQRLLGVDPLEAEAVAE